MVGAGAGEEVLAGGAGCEVVAPGVLLGAPLDADDAGGAWRAYWIRLACWA